MAEHYPWASPEAVARLTPAQQRMCVRLALKQQESGRTIHCDSVSEAQAKIEAIQRRKATR